MSIKIDQDLCSLNKLTTLTSLPGKVGIFSENEVSCIQDSSKLSISILGYFWSNYLYPRIISRIVLDNAKAVILSVGCPLGVRWVSVGCPLAGSASEWFSKRTKNKFKAFEVVESMQMGDIEGRIRPEFAEFIQ